MNNLVQNYKIILDKLIENCSQIKSFSQIRQPKLSDIELVALNVTEEYMSYNSELQLFKNGARTQNRTLGVQQTTQKTCRLHRKNPSVRV